MAEAAALFDALDPVLTRWTMGGAAAGVAPPGWREGIGADPGEAELRLLALSAQYLGVLVRPEPPAELRLLPDLPALALPPVPDGLRPLARRVLAATREGRARRELILLLAARGWTLHPGDWMPGTGDDDLPHVYAPWRDWLDAAAAQAPATRTPQRGLSAATWEDYWPAARLAALAELRRRDPAAARALLEARLAGEQAEVRLRLLGLLAVNLSDADRAFLESLATDRAPKVKALAASLLGRLGHSLTGGVAGGVAAGEDAAELAGFFEIVTKGLLRRTRHFQARPLKTAAQVNRRRALLAATDINGLAGALDTDPDALTESWSWGADSAVDHELVALAERSASDRVVEAIAELLGGGATIDVQGMMTLQPRLGLARRAAFARRVLGATGGTFQTALAIGGGGCGIDGAIESKAGQFLVAELAKPDGVAKRHDLPQELNALGLIASRGAAQAAMATLATIGLLAADPRLDIVRLNAALEPRETT